MTRLLRRIDFACNDPGNGAFEGRVRMVDFAGALQLEGDVYGAGYRFAVVGGRLRINRRWFTFVRYKAWYGNWYWDAFWFEPREAKRLIRHLRATGKWSVDGGWTKLCEWFKRADRGACA